MSEPDLYLPLNMQKEKVSALLLTKKENVHSSGKKRGEKNLVWD